MRCPDIQWRLSIGWCLLFFGRSLLPAGDERQVISELVFAESIYPALQKESLDWRNHKLRDR